MKNRSRLCAALLAMGALLAFASATWAGTASKNSKDSTAPTASASSTQDENLHLEGEKRFRSNCARCHLAPPKFSPRMMATIVRHMRVRANITDEDMRLVLRYMTE
jgi:mono/diheme cytochrome c family protein